MNGSKIYKRLAGGPKDPVRQTIGHVFMCIFVAAFMWGVVFVVVMQDSIAPKREPSNDNLMLGIIISSVAAGAALLVEVIFAKKRLRQIAKSIKKRREMLESMNGSDFRELDRQVEESEFYFKTFHLLDEYLYAPKARFIIKYTDIMRYDIKMHYGAGDGGIPQLCGAWLVITDEEGIVFEIKVRKWRQFLKSQYIFRDAITQKTLAQAKKKIDDLFTEKGSNVKAER